MVSHSSILAWKIPLAEKSGGYSPWGHKELDTTERLRIHTHTHTHTGQTLENILGMSIARKMWKPHP